MLVTLWQKMGLLLLTLITIVIPLIIYYYSILKKSKSYWSSKGVYTYETKTLNLRAIVIDVYNEIKRRNLKYGAVCIHTTQNFVPVDVDLIKTILIKDFEYFVNRSQKVNEKVDPLFAGLSKQTDQKWRDLRNKLSPTFTTGKMKMMTPTIVNTTNELIKHLEELLSNNNEPLNMKVILGRFTTDLIGRIAFGIECNSIKEGENGFRQLAKAFTVYSLKYKLQSFVPLWILDLIGLRHLKKENVEFISNVLRKIINYRESNNIAQKDFMHMMLQIKNRGAVFNDNDILDNGKPGNYLTFNEVVANCITFFVGASDTSSTLMTFVLMKLAEHDDIQTKVRNHIRKVLKDNNNEIDYDCIANMNYLEYVINETLRMYPPAFITTRLCSKPYNIPGTNLTMQKGDKVIIPIWGLHYDEEYYDKPHEFIPERFSPEVSFKRPAYVFIPFGDGPRKCIGNRFGLLQTKIALASIINNFKVRLSHKTKLPLKFEKNTLLLTVIGDIWLYLEKISN